jgi:chromosomal replication initiation ATPase DnaA
VAGFQPAIKSAFDNSQFVHMSRQYTLQRTPTSASNDIDYAAELNQQQLAAVTAPPGPILVIAGAGSGKTRTLTYRVAYLLENGIDPRNILLLTLTNKAAREMLGRVANLLPVDARTLGRDGAKPSRPFFRAINLGAERVRGNESGVC